jgi:diguanylate cyclase (GGDEF)-like protein/PAS domain S-box-containing protein
MPIKVVIVEDERIVALNLQQRLLKMGYAVPAIASSAEQALFFVGRDSPDLVLMDIHIDGDVDGIEAARRIGELFQTPIIYLTAYSEESTLERARATNPYGYLLKPFSERELHATMQMAIGRRQTELAYTKSEARLRFALQAARMCAWELNADTQEMSYSGDAEATLGIAGPLFLDAQAQFLSIVHEDDRSAVDSALQATIDDTLACEIEFRSCARDGAQRWLHLQGKAFSTLPGADGRHVIGVLQDVTERKAVEARLREAATVFEATQDGILILDTERRIVSVNQSFHAITGYTAAELIGEVPYLLRNDQQRQRDYQQLERALESGGRWRGELRSRRKDGTEFPILMTIVGVNDSSGCLSHYVLAATDLTAVRTVEQRLQYLAHHDPLTDLPNRLLTMERLAHALKRGKRRNERIALLFIDLDRFKWVNDTLGHAVGDELLAEVAARMKACIREDDTVGRFGGDEFLVILDPIGRLEDIAQVAGKIIDTLGAPLTLGGRALEVSCSIGISVFPDDGTTAEYLIHAADIAMYVAKEHGRHGYEFYAPTMTAKALRQLASGKDLQRGFEAEELLLHYQPQVSLRTKAVTGVEALIRWQHHRRGLLGAADVIAVAEEHHLIVDIGAWVLRKACRQVRLWRDMGLATPRIAVNVSAAQMHSPRFIEILEQVLAETQIPPQQLELEITEATLHSGSGCSEMLAKLERLGVSIALDDFGSGYSSVGELNDLPIRRVKIDRPFVSSSAESCGDGAVAEAIIAMAHRLRLQVTAEGIETAEQEQLLRACDCDEAQGYLYAQPMPANAIVELLRAG